MSVTALDVAARLRASAGERAARARARADGLRQKLPEAVTILERHGARRVWLFGSLATEAAGLESDVDLAVEGLPGSGVIEALAELFALFGTRVDLVRIEDAPESLRERIAATGAPL